MQADKEKEIQAAFQKTLAMRAKGAEAKDVADRYFFETFVIFTYYVEGLHGLIKAGAAHHVEGGPGH